MIGAVAAVIVAVVALPHLLPQARLAPASGVALWVSVLSLRALLAVVLAMIVVLYLPATELFGLVTQWCVHAVIPFIATHLGLSGHGLGDAATLVPTLVVAASALSAPFGIWRGARAVRHWLRKSSLGRGPRESVIVGGPEILVAAAGLFGPRVVVSAGALTQLDEAELAAGLEHEWGHVARRHRFASLCAQLLFAVARPLPGSRRVLEQLHFHLERDADEYAVRRTGDRLALASAICKAAGAERPGGTEPALARLGGPGVGERVGILLSDAAIRGVLPTGVARGLTAIVTGLVLAIALSAPAVAQTGLAELQQEQSSQACQD